MNGSLEIERIEQLSTNTGVGSKKIPPLCILHFALSFSLTQHAISKTRKHSNNYSMFLFDFFK